MDRWSKDATGCSQPGEVGSSASLAGAGKLMSSALDTVSVTWPWEIQEQLYVPLGDSGESPGQEVRVSASPHLASLEAAEEMCTRKI